MNVTDVPTEVAKTTSTPVPAPVARRDLSGAFVWAFCGFILLIVLSAPLLALLNRTKGAGTDVTFDRLRFTAVNAATLTGFQTSLPPRNFKEPAQYVVLFLTLLGISFTLIVGGLAAARILRSRYTDVEIIRFALSATSVLVTIGATPFLLRGHSIVESFMLGASAFGNSGVTVGQAPGLYNWRTHFVLLPLAVLGSLGLPVLQELWDVVRLRGTLSAYSRVVLSMSAALYLAGLILFVLCQLADSGGVRLREIFASSSIAAINTRTFGLHVQFAGDWPRAMQWLAIPLMLIGGASAGTAGGFKLTTAALLARGIGQVRAGQPVSRLFASAAMLVACYVALLLVFLTILLITQPQVNADRLFFETASAISNTGLSFDAIANVSSGLDITSLAMLCGRLLPLGFLCWIACRDEQSDIAVG